MSKYGTAERMGQYREDPYTPGLYEIMTKCYSLNKIYYYTMLMLSQF